VNFDRVILQDSTMYHFTTKVRYRMIF